MRQRWELPGGFDVRQYALLFDRVHRLPEAPAVFELSSRKEPLIATTLTTSLTSLVDGHANIPSPVVPEDVINYR